MHEHGNSEIEIKLKISSISSTSFYMCYYVFLNCKNSCKVANIKTQNTKSRGGAKLQNWLTFVSLKFGLPHDRV